MAYELAPAYADAEGATQASLAVTMDTLPSISLITNYAGDSLLWGVTIPMFAYAILKTSVVPRWIGVARRRGRGVRRLARLLGPASSLIEGISSIGFLAFFIFMLSMGIALLRRRSQTASSSNTARRSVARVGCRGAARLMRGQQGRPAAARGRRKERNVPKTLWPKSIWLAPVVALALIVLPTMAAQGGGGTQEAEYVVLYDQSASLAAAREAVEAAGGQIVKENTDVGVATVASGNATFLTDVAAQAALDGAARNAPVGRQEPLEVAKRDGAALTAAERAAIEATEGRRPQRLCGDSRAARRLAVGHGADPRDRGRLVRHAAR